MPSPSSPVPPGPALTSVRRPAAAAPPPQSDPTAAGTAGRRLWDRVSLLWLVFAANIAVFVVAAALLAWTPVTVHRVATPSELVVLAIGVALMLAVDLVLLRRAFAPLRRLASMMERVDPGQPGRRAQAPRGAGREVIALATALNDMLDRLEGERRESGRRALAAQESERKRIARELHDEIGQTLTAIALRAERAAGEPSPQRAALAEMAETVLQSLEDVHRIGRELRPEALDDLGLVNALIVLCSRIDGEAGLHVRRNLEWELPPLSPEVELVIYRVAQEALTNVLRHATATEATVALHPEDERVVLTVTDDGRGLPAEVREGGLSGMRERAMLIEAQLAVGPGPGGGTEIVLTVPTGARAP
ncbi:MAG TPA: sensor histidine kinase [Solirubrobacteraceae bacterium]|jgi:two-component system sensor histidine kinase UhpB|nr:sensor histidine kinase [Solirubrobacteraceae bacterium]